ncbi:sensor histidine kinase [Acetivibrio cellulolyticus]|uniref:sensor histidine kinase n=1 Tax=Acetivibrio cellulolyticus TaxID=35830 RepID=UPI0001E2C7B1|nr:histidine kinase N-terminal 7TM domain-containing protein [Acetivibrio cellulolyticus]
MAFKLQLTVFIYLTSIVLLLALIVFVLIEGKRTKLLYSFVFLMSTNFVWSLGLLFESLSITREQGFSVLKFYYSGICYLGFAWLIFCLCYSNSKIISRKKNIFFLAIAPTLQYLSLLTNELHHLFYFKGEDGRQFGIFFWVHFVFSYTYIITGTFILIRYALRCSTLKRNQTVLVIIAAVIPLIFNILYLIFKFKIEITPFGFIISSILFLVASFKYSFLDVESRVLKNYADTLQEAICVFDKDLRIIKYNKAFKCFLPNPEILSGVEKASDIALLLEKIIKKTKESEKIVQYLQLGVNEPFSGEIILKGVREQSYRVNINPILNPKGQTIGTAVSFDNIQEYRDLIKEMNNKNNELIALNRQISGYALKVEELAIVKERNRIAQDVHDTLGHTLVSIITLAEALDMTYGKDETRARKIIKDLMKISKDGMNELRRSISGMAPESLEANHLIKAVSELTERFSHSGLRIDLTYEGSSEYVDREVSDNLLKICQEAVTNSIKHGKACNIKIMFIFYKASVKLFIFDDGAGCADIQKGNGLSGMEERIRKLSGKIVFGSDGEKGFNIHIEVPLK